MELNVNAANNKEYVKLIYSPAFLLLDVNEGLFWLLKHLNADKVSKNTI